MSVLLQVTSQHGESLIQPGLHRAERTSLHLGDFLERHAVILLQDDRRALLFGQSSHRLLDNIDPEQRSFVDEFLKDRAGQSLAHVFTLLSLVLPTAPLQIAYRGLHTDDPKLRGTALEYLEGVLPQDLSQRLWPFLGREQQAPRDVRQRDEILADLLRSNESIMLNLEELRKRVDKGA